MRIIFITSITVAFILISCQKQVKNKFDKYYEVINEFAKLQVLDSNTILALELIGIFEYPVEVTIPKNDSNLTLTYLHPPPIPDASQISK